MGRDEEDENENEHDDNWNVCKYEFVRVNQIIFAKSLHSTIYTDWVCVCLFFFSSFQLYICRIYFFRSNMTISTISHTLAW